MAINLYSGNKFPRNDGAISYHKTQTIQGIHNQSYQNNKYFSGKNTVTLTERGILKCVLKVFE